MKLINPIVSSEAITIAVHFSWRTNKPQSTDGSREYTSCAGRAPIESAHAISAMPTRKSKSVSATSVGVSVA